MFLQAFYNRVNTTTTRLSQATLAAQTTDSAYEYFTVFQDIADASRIGIKNWLFPGDATANAAAGYYLTYLRSLNTINIAFNVRPQTISWRLADILCVQQAFRRRQLIGTLLAIRCGH